MRYKPRTALGKPEEAPRATPRTALGTPYAVRGMELLEMPAAFKMDERRDERAEG